MKKAMITPSERSVQFSWGGLSVFLVVALIFGCNRNARYDVYDGHGSRFTIHVVHFILIDVPSYSTLNFGSSMMPGYYSIDGLRKLYDSLKLLPGEPRMLSLTTWRSPRAPAIDSIPFDEEIDLVVELTVDSESAMDSLLHHPTYLSAIDLLKADSLDIRTTTTTYSIPAPLPNE